MKNGHEHYMEYALRLALKAQGRTSPNPLVGAVVVKNGRIIGRGFHERCGAAHAEVVALDDAGRHAKGATLYVTLEPCVHFGRTPPCVDRIIQSGVKRVVIGMVDPNPLNNGKGIQILRNHKIFVEAGFCEEKLRKVNASFIKFVTQRLPLVTVKIAESLDGRIATRTGDSRWITSDRSRTWSHRMRASYDAIMVGVNTVLRDDPKLDAWYSDRHPVKVVVDSQLSTPQKANIFSGKAGVILVTLPVGPGQTTENRAVLGKKAKILEAKGREGQINLKDMLKKLARQGIANLLVEGGGTLIGSLFDEGLVDRVMFFISPKIIGGKDAIGSVMGHGVARLDSAVRIANMHVRRFGEDILVEGDIKK
ncbi:MAG: bifunctional diaminohydroxyphosphoribosylaminopyrimidine deaminase/5-amino-6-(5-phosphoribosylamino)uracil reductase RibD [Candidatus Omnitrophica bacterium]|nr:bifunctional diaminohydroxyphosphoribosylaminopyrimidine deaminase/5-amino-6-(5-phosphoribosylamino)uracil reductase RibD [Candidatus Omnitrophota bacterium]MDD5775209.1 bifunctional diaminohydroxyphosphoribosylaminopyrimidine deaminase/5-amino-6-(5-phosphoribosylamino)uracil reductase RibD [Candidatus Omnitrophota bacterium]